MLSCRPAHAARRTEFKPIGIRSSSAPTRRRNARIWRRVPESRFHRTRHELKEPREVSAGSRAPAFGNITPGLRQLALTAVREDSGQLVLREVEDRDLSVLFEHATDPDAIRMAAFTSPDFDDRTAFERRWARLRSDGSTTNRIVEIDGRVVGHIASFDLEGRREVTYWIGREHWGRGIATRALQEFLQVEATRPLYAGAASDNAASIRVLTKCGFLIVGEGRGFAYGRNEETDEVVLRLDA